MNADDDDNKEFVEDHGEPTNRTTSVILYDGGHKEEDNNDIHNEDTEGSATFWSDETGNLKFVNLVVRCPCCIFCSLLAACLVITVLLFVALALDGNPFADPENESDLDHVTSIHFDSLRLAQEDVEDLREIAQGATAIPRQSETADYTYWVFEAETPEGCFGSRTSIAAMKEAFDLFLDHAQYKEYCLLLYDINDPTAEPYCDLPITSLNMYYPSQWDEQLVEEVLTDLRVPGNVELFDALSLCATYGLYCDQLGQVTEEDEAWALDLNTKLQNITQYWDLSGELVPNITQATEVAAYLNQIALYKGLIDFGFDKGFGVNNLVSRYSRGVLTWGGPLGNTTALTAEEKEDQDEDDEEERKEYVST